MWVPRTPKRADFCGCPPCPLCYDWATDAPAGRVQDAWVQEIISGMTKFTQDMLDGTAPTEAEEQVLKDAAEKIHVANLSRDERIAEEIRVADKAQHTARQMNAMLATKRSEAAVPKPLNTITLDGMDLSYVEEEERRKKEPKIPSSPWTNDISGFTWIFDEMLRNDIARQFYIPQSSFINFGMDLAKPAEPEAPKLTDKDRRRIQAEDEAKKRMKLQAREPVRR